MPLQNAIQLIVTVDDGAGSFHCAAFDGLGLPNPVLIQFCHVGTRASQSAMDRLAAALLAELNGGAKANALQPPCGGRATECHAINEPDCQKLLILVGDDITPVAWANLPRSWRSAAADFAILPILPESARHHAPSLLPGQLSAINIAFWDQAVEEALPTLFQVAGISATQPRIFISYRQSDTAAAAIQLFDALSHDGFDVFLDHFRVPPGVNFQARLRQELGDKSIVLVLESPNLASSPWVAFEIAEARACGLGLIALNFGGAPQIAGIDPRYRHLLAGAEINADQTMVPATLSRVRAFIRREHDLAILRRRILLEQSFEQAVVQAGGAAPHRQPDGSFVVNAGRRSYRTWLTPRPPELPDYHRAHGGTQPPAAGVIIGLSQLMEVSRQRQHEWLAGLCNMTLVDEGMITRAAADMVQGTL